MRRSAILGGWGSGKSVGLMLRFARMCALNGTKHRRKKGIAIPKAALIAPTYKILQQSTLATFDAIFPPEWVRRRRGHPNPVIELVNDVVIELHSGNTLEGTNYFAVGVEEIQHRNYTERAVTNMVARVRDKDAEFLSETFSGLPEAGRVREMFDVPPRPPTQSDGGAWTILCATKENTALPKETLSAIMSTTASEEATKLLGGEWFQPMGAAWPEYDSKLHLTDYAGDPRDWCDVGLDPGELGAVVFGQERMFICKQLSIVGGPRPELGIVVVDQILPEHQDVEAICLAIKTHKRQWRVRRFFTDPTIGLTERNVLRKYFPLAEIVRKDVDEVDSRRGARRALRDALGNVRCQIWNGLRAQKRGVLEALVGAETGSDGRVKQDKWLEHAHDAFRYLVAGVVPVPFATHGPEAYKRWSKG